MERFIHVEKEGFCRKWYENDDLFRKRIEGKKVKTITLVFAMIRAYIQNMIDFHNELKEADKIIKMNERMKKLEKQRKKCLNK